MPYYMKRKAGTGKTGKRSSLKDRLDKVFSLYIRLRDAMPNGYFRCISCGEIKPFDQADCGHYFSRTHLATRFDEQNCHAECRYCNRFKADHLDGYRENLIRKIGQRNFDLLRIRHQSSSQMSEFEYRELIKYYKVRCEMLKKEKGL